MLQTRAQSSRTDSGHCFGPEAKWGSFQDFYVCRLRTRNDADCLGTLHPEEVLAEGCMDQFNPVRQPETTSMNTLVPNLGTTHKALNRRPSPEIHLLLRQEAPRDLLPKGGVDNLNIQAGPTVGSSCISTRRPPIDVCRRSVVLLVQPSVLVWENRDAPKFSASDPIAKTPPNKFNQPVFAGIDSQDFVIEANEVLRNARFPRDDEDLALPPTSATKESSCRAWSGGPPAAPPRNT